MLDALPHEAHSDISGFTLSSARRSRFDVDDLSRSRAAPKSLLQDSGFGGVVETRCVNVGVT